VRVIGDSMSLIAAASPLGAPMTPAAEATLILFLALVVADRLLVTRYGGSSPDGNAPADRRTYRQILILQGAALVIAISAARWIPALGLGAGVWAARVALMVLGRALRLWAVAALGREFRRVVTVRADQPVIDTGPYRWVRHPSYTGILVFYLGVGMALANVISITALAVLPAIGYVRRIYVAEAALTDTLGDRYRTYASTRRRLVPGVW
jgi:protein-S-isoprenylcysteine O-methyltransferase Ste14